MVVVIFALVRGSTHVLDRLQLPVLECLNEEWRTTGGHGKDEGLPYSRRCAGVPHLAS
jgi:hypothetical protein